jgi:hypothetical protein
VDNMKKLFIVLLMLSNNTFAELDNQQEGSLNTSNNNSTVSSNNTTTDGSTSNTYNGAGSSSEIPVGSAISPTYMSNGSETCLQGTGGSLQTVAVGFSSGTYKKDFNCNRRRDAKVLSDLGMKVAAIARMCEDITVWRSMFLSGTPCPILQRGKLVVGKRAFLVMKTQPEIYIPDYGKVKRSLTDTQVWYNTILGIGESINEENTEDTVSISDRFRSSSK